jgi:hypothetical protein
VDQGARVDGFFIDPHPVTNRQFAGFVAVTGYRTVAASPLDPADYPVPRRMRSSPARWYSTRRTEQWFARRQPQHPLRQGVTTPPPSCSSINFGGAYYRPYYSGSSVFYEVIANPE